MITDFVTKTQQQDIKEAFGLNCEPAKKHVCFGFMRGD